jgi:DivIVA domain-containing protein
MRWLCHTFDHERQDRWPVARRIGQVAPVTGDEVRDTWFLDTDGGYLAPDVDELLRRVAAELDAGRPAGPLIENATFRPTSWRKKYSRGYDIDAVDWFLGQLLRLQDHAGPGGTSADPWRDVGGMTQLVLGGVSGLAQRYPPPNEPTPRQARKWFEERCENACRGFGLLPGTHLSYVPVSLFMGELRTAEQQTLASARTIWSMGKTTLSAGGRTFTRLTSRASSSLPGIVDISNRSTRDYDGHCAKSGSLGGPSYRARAIARALVDEAQVPILYTSGANYNSRACARISFPDGRWLRFLVQGTRKANAVMSAVDQAGNKVARYRQGAGIIVHPDQSLTNELVLAITISVPWLASYFDRPSEGDGI